MRKGDSMSTRHRAVRGVTLLEILVSMTILGLVAAGIMTAFVFSRRVTRATDFRAVATRYTQETAEDLRLAINQSLVNPHNNQLTLVMGTTNQSHALPGNSGLPTGATRRYTVRTGKFNGTTGAIIWGPGNDELGNPINDTNGHYDIKEVTVTVHWDPPAAQ